MVNYITYEWDLADKHTNLNHSHLEFVITSGGEERNLRHFNLGLHTGDGGDDHILLAEEMSLSQLVELRDFLNGIKFTDKEETNKREGK